MNNEQLKSYVERINRVKDEIEGLNQDVKEIMNEAVASGYDRKALTKVISIMRADRNELNEQEALLNTYRQALDV